MLNLHFRRVVVLLLALLVAACGSGASRARNGSASGAVTISPAAIYLAPLGTYTFEAVVAGQPDAGITWSVKEGSAGGEVTTSGVYTAPDAEGTYHVVATSSDDPTQFDFATVTVSIDPVVVVSVSPRNRNVSFGGSITFRATVTGTNDAQVDWSVQESNGGTVTNGGVYTAPDREGTYHVVATSRADNTKSGSATVTVTGNATPADSGAPPMTGPLVVSPEGTTLISGASQQFTCSKPCTWAVQEGASGGTVTNAGVYTAPGASGTYHAVATARDAPSETGTVRIIVIDPTAPGVWTNVTPVGISLDPNVGGANNNFGVLDVVADPARPGHVYAFVCYQGVWRSEDYGITWVKVSTGKNQDMIESGRPWTAAIDPNKTRDPSTPPTLYTVSGYGTQFGVYKSTDGGVNWEHYDVHGSGDGLAAEDLYSLDVNPYDSSHLIGGFHEWTGLVESTDAGVTWRVVNTPGGLGKSVYPFFINTGDAATTRRTWLTQAQWGTGTEGMWRTTDGGGTWTQVDTGEHGHGGSQIYQAGGGVIFTASFQGSEGHGIYKSTDYGVNWSKVFDVQANGVFGTPNYLWASNGPYGSSLVRAPTNPGTAWESIPSPAGLDRGAKTTATLYDGTRYILVAGNWQAGLWRYVE